MVEDASVDVVIDKARLRLLTPSPPRFPSSSRRRAHGNQGANTRRPPPPPPQGCLDCFVTGDGEGDVGRYLATLARVLAPGGRALLFAVNGADIPRLLRTGEVAPDPFCGAGRAAAAWCGAGAAQPPPPVVVLHSSRSAALERIAGASGSRPGGRPGTGRRNCGWRRRGTRLLRTHPHSTPPPRPATAQPDPAAPSPASLTRAPPAGGRLSSCRHRRRWRSRRSICSCAARRRWPRRRSSAATSAAGRACC